MEFQYLKMTRSVKSLNILWPLHSGIKNFNTTVVLSCYLAVSIQSPPGSLYMQNICLKNMEYILPVILFFKVSLHPLHRMLVSTQHVLIIHLTRVEVQDNITTRNNVISALGFHDFMLISLYLLKHNIIIASPTHQCKWTAVSLKEWDHIPKTYYLEEVFVSIKYPG